MKMVDLRLLNYIIVPVKRCREGHQRVREIFPVTPPTETEAPQVSCWHTRRVLPLRTRLATLCFVFRSSLADSFSASDHRMSA